MNRPGARGAGAIAVVSLTGILLSGASPASATQTGAPAATAACEEGKTQYVTDTPTALVRLGAREAWTIATGAGVTVAVVDSGVADANAHFPDGVVLPGTSFVGGSARRDPLTHGTAVAGTIAARSIGSRSGVEGLAPGSRILPVKVVPEEQRGDGEEISVADVANGIRYAADNGAQVINVSLSTSRDDPRLKAAVEHATAKGSLVVASAGHRRTEEDPRTGRRYPAAYPQVLAVAATDNDDRVTDDSLHGPHVDIAAPGRDVLTTWGAWGDCYLSQDGESTSYAAGYVSAAAALVVQRFPTDGPARWKHRLEATASRDRRDARDDTAGWGLVQPVEALTAVLDQSIAGPLAPGATPAPSATVEAAKVAVGPMPDLGERDRREVVWVVVAAGTAALALALARLARRRPRA
ncbi:MAG: S8 family serine peptidase [Ornithinibacter sp.]